MIVTNCIRTYLISLYIKSDYASYFLDECLFSMSKGTISSFLSSFKEIDAMFLKFDEDLNNTVDDSSSMGDNSGESLGMLAYNYLNLFLIFTCCFNLFNINFSTISDFWETCVVSTPGIGAVHSHQW